MTNTGTTMALRMRTGMTTGMGRAWACTRHSHAGACLTTTSCATRSPRRRWLRWSPASVGYFLVLRGQTFAGHALAHVGFTGATGAVLVGIAPLWGMVLMTVAAGIGMGCMGERLAQRDVAIGIVLSLSLGFGLLFLHFYTAFATQATALLFGNVLAVDAARSGCCWGSAW